VSILLTGCGPPDGGEGADLVTDLAAYYPLNGNLTDASGNGRDLTSSGTPTYAAAKLGQGLAATAGGGTQTYSPATNLLTGSFSISCWLYGTQGVNIAFYNDGANIGWSQMRLVYYARTSSSRGVRLFLSGHIDSLGVDAQVVSDAWNHVVAVWDHVAQTRTIWMNGVNAYSETVADVNGNAFANFAVLTQTGEGTFPSPVDEVAVYTRALGAAEVAALYNGGSGFNPASV
jgi:hypothetical protein